MSRQTFDTADVLRLEVEDDPTGLVNLIQNPTGELGGWGWVTPLASSAITAPDVTVPLLGLNLGPALKYERTVAGASHCHSESLPMAAGEWVAAYWMQPFTGTTAYHRARFEFLDSAGAVLSSTAQTALTAPGSGSEHSTAAYQAPASTAFVRLRFDCYTSGGANPTGSHVLRWIRATVATATTAAALSGLGYVEPVPYVNILEPAHDITITREALNVGTLSAIIRDAALDPAHDTLIRPGRRCRVTALVGGRWRPLFSGKLTRANVTYDLKDPAIPESKRARIVLSASDNTAPLANQNRPEGVSTVDELPYVLEGCGVPWNVNGSGDQVPSATVAAYNENASALDQVAITRDTALAYAWIDRLGVCQVFDAAQMPTTVGVTLDDDAYSGLDVDYDTGRLINHVTVKVQALVDATQETTELTYGPYRDEASIATWGVSAAEFTVYALTNAFDPAAYAAAVLAANATPALRVNAVTVPVLTEDHIGDYALADLYTLANVVNTDAALDEDYRIVTLQHRITPDAWLIGYGFETDGSVAAPTATPSPSTGAGGKTLGQLLRPVGEVTMHAGTSVPDGWLECDGSSFSGTDFPDLADVLGSTTLPDFRNRLPVGVGNNHALGDNDGRAQGSRSLVPEIAYSTVSNTTTGGSATRVNNVNNAGNTELPHYALRFIIRAV